MCVGFFLGGGELSECHYGNVWFVTCDEHRGGSKYKISGMKLVTSNDSINLCFELLYIYIYSEGAM